MSVFHLKYRPVRIDELDLVEVSGILKKILAQKEIPQSFLFTGPKGSGKTSAARILARAVNCLEPVGVEPCGKCNNCEEIAKNSSMDIIEIDAASNRGIEDMRSLKDKAYLLPSKLKRKVFIIDEVHMLTKEAFNAFLKLIEEPPKHTIFILCTTDAEKIPETVLSRLIRVDFHKGGKKELANSLKKIIEGEKIEIGQDAIDLIIKKSDGSFRNLQRTLNEIYLSLGKKMNLDDVKSFYITHEGDYNEEEFEGDLAEGKISVILQKLESLAKKGIDFVTLRQRFLQYFQTKLLVNYGVGNLSEKSKLDSSDLEKLIGLLILAAKQEKDVDIDQLPLELAVVEFLREENKISDVRSRPTALDVALFQISDEEKKEEKTEGIIHVVDTSKMVDLKINEVEEKWGEILMMVKPYNHSVEAFLRSARPKEIRHNLLVVEVFYPFHKDRLEETKNKKLVETVLAKVFNVDLVFGCVLAKSKKEPLVITNDVISIPEEEKKDLYDVAKEIFG